ncbi:MAG: FtsX-like permease family protein [Candidatus Thorarchaeota archaeon]
MFLLSRLSSRAPAVILTMLIFSLSSGVVGGVLIFMDSAAPDVLVDMTTQVPIDMEISFTSPFYTQTNMTIQDMENDVIQQEYVIGTQQVTLADFHDYSEREWEFERKGFLGTNHSTFDEFPGAIDLLGGELTYDDNSCLVEVSLFNRENLEVGSNYTLSLYYYDQWGHPVWIERTFNVTGVFKSNIYMQSRYYGRPPTTYLLLITTQQTVHDLFDALGHGDYNGINDKIWVRFDKSIVTRTDVVTLRESLRNVKSRIEQNNLPFVSIRESDFGLLGAIDDFTMWSLSMRTIAVAFSIPSIIMGVMLIYYDSRLHADQRRRDVGTLKTRGASGMQAFGWVLSSALITGLLGSIGALLTGTLGALISGTVTELLSFDLRRLEGFAIIFQPSSVISVFLFSFTVGVVVALPGAINALVMTPTEAHSVIRRDVLTDSEEMGSVTIDLMAIGVSVWLLPSLLTLTSFISLSGESPTVLYVTFVLLFGIALFFFARLLSRPTSTLKSRVLGRIQRPSLLVGARLMSRTIRMFKKSETMGTMFIAMVFTAGLFASISSTTGSTHMKQLFMFQTGADIAVEFDPILSNITLDLMPNITAIEGVEQVTPILEVGGVTQYWDAQPYGGGFYVNRSITVYGVDPDSWVSASFWLDYFTLENSPRVSVQRLTEDLAEEGEVNIISSFRPVQTYVIDSIGNLYPTYGDQLGLALITSEGRVNRTICHIIDVLADQKDANYQTRTYLTGEPDARDFLVMSIDYLHDATNTSRITKVLVDIAPTANYTSVMEDINEVAKFSIERITAAQEQIDDALESRATQTVFGTYTLNVLFSIVYLTIGMAIVSTVRVRGLRRQISILRALGAGSRSIVIASLVETSVGVLLAAGIGAVIGVILSFIFMNLPLVYIGVSTLYTWTRLPVLLQIPLVLVTLIVTIAVGVSLAATYYVLRRTLSLNIAEEIQYTE